MSLPSLESRGVRMATNRALRLSIGLALAAATAACASVESAAARDPMKCERDPTCAKARTSYADCTRQCVDDPECTHRCEQMQVDRLGHP